MNARLERIRCFKCDMKKVWRNLSHGKVAKWTLIVHFIYYVHATGTLHGGHMITSAACAAAILIDLFYDNTRE